MCRNQGRMGENIPSVFVLWNNLRGFYLRYRTIILHFTLIGRMWVRPGIQCWARGSKGGSGHFPDTRAHSGTRGWHGDTCQCVSTTQSAQTCQMRSNYERILRTLDWAYQSWLMSSCQGRVRVISSKAQSSADVYISPLLGRLQKVMTGIMIARWTRGPAPWPRARNARIMQITVSPCVCEHVYSSV